MKKLKVGLIGTGYIGMVHLEMLRRIVGAEVVAIADSNAALAKAAADKLDVKKVYSKAEDLINDKEVEVLHNCAPNNVHFEFNRKAVESGRDVLSEKPLSLNAKESARVRRGDLGDVRAFVGHFLQDWLFYDTDYSWRLDPAVAGGANVIADLGSHWCDLVQFITGRKIVEVMAELHTCIPKRKRPKSGPLSFSTQKVTDYDEVEIKLDDYAGLFLRLDNGARGNFTTCQVAGGRKVDIEIQVFGTKESYAWSHVHPNALWIGHRERGNEVFYESSQLQAEDTRKYAALPTGHPMGYHDAVYNLFRDFYEAVAAKREGKPFTVRFPDFHTGHDEMCVLGAAVESNKSGRWTKVER
jgi:predicted dehydrogenase